MFEEQSADYSYSDSSGGYSGGGSADQGIPDQISGMELASSPGLWTGGFWNRFHGCMTDMGVPAPDSLFSTFTTAVATIRAIQQAVSTYGTEVTIAELVGAGVLSDALLVAGALSASAYVGVCVGCLASAGIDMSGLI